MNIRAAKGSLVVSDFEYELLELRAETCGLSVEVRESADGLYFADSDGNDLIALVIDEWGQLRVQVSQPKTLDLSS